MKSKNILINLLLVFFGLFVSLVLIEIVLWILYPAPHVFTYRDPVSGAVFKPGDSGWYSAAPDGLRHKIIINSKGLRDKEYSYSKPDGTFRILILGDSMTAGLAVPRKNLFTEVLEQRLNDNNNGDYEVINAGVPARSVPEELRYYLNEGYKYESDLVLLAFYIGNDVRIPNSEASQIKVVANRIVPKESLGFVGRIKAVLAHSHLYRFVGNIIPSVFPSFASLLRKEGLMTKPWLRDLFIFAKDYPEWVIESWDRTKDLILELKNTVELNESRLAILFIPVIHQVDTAIWQENLELNPDKKQVAWNLDKPNKYLGSWLKTQEIDYIDFLPIFRQEKKENNKRHYLRFDRHLNKYGHKVIGENLHSWVSKECNL